MKTRLTVGSLTDTGLMRTINEDSIFCKKGDGIHIFCVADGMGGHAHGEKASGEIIEAIKKWEMSFYPEKYDCDFIKILDGFGNCLQDVNGKIYRQYNAEEVCGSTVAALLIYEGFYAVFSLGDSRIYRMRRFRFEQITTDDTWQNSADVFGCMDDVAMRLDSRYDKLVKAVGIRENVVFHRMTDRLRRGDTFLLCSDGIYKTCDLRVLRRICAGMAFGYGRAEEKMKKIKICAYQKNAPDNLSAILVHVNDIKK